MNILHNCIPTIAYHQICSTSKITPEIFEEQIKYLYESGFKTVTLDEFYFYVTGKGKISGKKILITFDDGFTDNFVYAYPILKKYGFSGIIFLITSRVTVSDTVRFNYDDFMNGVCKEGELYKTNQSKKANIDSVIYGKTKDFLTSAEIKKMYADSVMDFQSHTHLHAKCFSENEILDFFNPNTHWYVLFETDGKFDYGAPIYKMKSAAASKRFFDDKNLRQFLVGYVTDNGGIEFFKNKNYKKVLFGKAADFKAKYGLNESYESDKEYKERVAADLLKSKEIIQGILNKKTEYLCWPWGEFSSTAIEIAKKCGFKGIFSLQRGANGVGCDVYNLKRLEVKAKDLVWFKKRVNIYSSSVMSRIYSIILL